MSIYGAETIGTAILILLGDGVVAATLLARSKAENGGWIVITFGWAMGVAMAVYAVGAFSGGHLNPAVTLGFAVIGITDWSDVPTYLAGEFSGAFIGAMLVWAAYLNHWRPTEDPGLKLAVLLHRPGLRHTVNNLITEIIGTFLLVFVVLAIRHGRGIADSGPRPAAGRPARARHRPLARRPDRLRDQPGARPHAADHACDPAHPRQGRHPTGATPGSPWSARSSAASSAPWPGTLLPGLIPAGTAAHERAAPAPAPPADP